MDAYYNLQHGSTFFRRMKKAGFYTGVLLLLLPLVFFIFFDFRETFTYIVSVLFVLAGLALIYQFIEFSSARQPCFFKINHDTILFKSNSLKKIKSVHRKDILKIELTSKSIKIITTKEDYKINFYWNSSCITENLKSQLEYFCKQNNIPL